MKLTIGEKFKVIAITLGLCLSAFALIRYFLPDKKESMFLCPCDIGKTCAYLDGDVEITCSRKRVTVDETKTIRDAPR